VNRRPTSQASDMVSTRVHLNPTARAWTWPGPTSVPEISPVLAFHKTLPAYGPSPLLPLPSIAKSLGVAGVFLKDESARFGLPSFKMLGASWAVYRALLKALALPDAFDPENAIPMASLGDKAREAGLSLITSTVGNCGRAVARMAKYLSIPAEIYVPRFMPEATREKIRNEGAHVLVVDGGYDDTIPVIRRKAEAGMGQMVLVLDVALEGFIDVPAVCHSTSTSHHPLFGTATACTPTAGT
jgi:diaminopropionate ammonia-lyase